MNNNGGGGGTRRDGTGGYPTFQGRGAKLPGGAPPPNRRPRQGGGGRGRAGGTGKCYITYLGGGGEPPAGRNPEAGGGGPGPPGCGVPKVKGGSYHSRGGGGISQKGEDTWAVGVVRTERDNAGREGGQWSEEASFRRKETRRGRYRGRRGVLPWGWGGGGKSGAEETQHLNRSPRAGRTGGGVYAGRRTN